MARARLFLKGIHGITDDPIHEEVKHKAIR